MTPTHATDFTSTSSPGRAATVNVASDVTSGPYTPDAGSDRAYTMRAVCVCCGTAGAPVIVSETGAPAADGAVGAGVCVTVDMRRSVPPSQVRAG